MPAGQTARRAPETGPHLGLREKPCAATTFVSNARDTPEMQMTDKLTNAPTCSDTPEGCQVTRSDIRVSEAQPAWPLGPGGARFAPTSAGHLAASAPARKPVLAHAPATGNETQPSPGLCAGNRTRAANVTQARIWRHLRVDEASENPSPARGDNPARLNCLESQRQTRPER